MSRPVRELFGGQLSRAKWFGLTYVLCIALVFGVTNLVAAQVVPSSSGAELLEETEETAEEQRERETAERFFDLLKRRPRLGTALDKVYGFHVGRGTLDDFTERLRRDASESDDGNLWLVLGMVQMQRGQDAFAADALEKAESLLPDEPLASYYLGKTLVLVGDVDKAADAMRRAIDKKPPRADALQIFQDLGRIYQRTGRNQEALETWSQLETLFPDDTGVQEQIAAILADEGAEEAALERYIALASSSKDRFRQVEMSIRAAQLKAKLGKTSEALADFEKQLAVVNPESWLYRDIRRRIEEVFWASNDFDGLVDYYTQWVEAHPDDIDAMMRTARVLSIQKRGPEAQQWFRKAIERAPTNVEARQALVEALATDGEYGKAAEEMKQLVDVEPDNPDLIVRWGELVLEDADKPLPQRKQEASEIWMRLLTSRGDDAVAVARVADLLRSAELPEQAIEQYRKAISLAENEPQYREYLGEYLHQLQRKEEALAVWDELATGERHTRDNLVRLSEVLSTFNYDEMALAKMAEACQMKPEFGHRARYAQLLREAGSYDQALAQLELAESQAEDRELRELVIGERIKNYQARGDLAERIAELETAVAGQDKLDPAAWRLLALMREANRAFQPACDAIDKATLLAGDDALYWETAAALYERTGRFGEAIKAYRKLATIDRRFLTNYLTQIASLEMRLGNTEAALTAGEELLSAAPGNSDNYRFFAGLCMQAGQNDRGLDALRRNVRSNPTDQDALNFLAKTLADEFQTDEAIELYWRSFDLARDVDGKLPMIDSLAELYLRTNRFDMLLSRLEIISREQNRPRDGTLWIAAAHKAAGDFGMARQLLEQLVREDSRDTRLLEQLVDLSKTEYDFETAAEYQKRLVAISPSPQREYLLASLLMDLGAVDEAQGLWLKLSQHGRGTSDMLSSINSLIDKEQYEIAGNLIERAVQMEPDNWEFAVPAMIVQVRTDDLEGAKLTSRQVLAMQVDPAEPTQKTKEAMAKAATQRNTAPANDPYANLGNPSRLLSSMRQVQQVLQPRANDAFYGGYGGSARSQTYTPTCFADARAVAIGVELLAIADAAERKQFIMESTQEALEGTNRDELWEALSYNIWEQPNALYSNEGPSGADNFEKCLMKLVDLGDADAARTLLSRDYNLRMRAVQQGAAEPMSESELERLKEMNALASDGTAAASSSYMQFWIVDELRRAGKTDEAGDMFDEAIAASSEPMQLVQAASMSLRILASSTADDEEAKAALQTAIPLYIRALNTTDSKARNAQYIGSSVAQIIPTIGEYGDIGDAIQLVDAALQLQARLTAEMRPSQRDQSPAGSQQTSYSYQLSGQYQRVSVAFPPPSGYFSAPTILALHSLVETAKRQERLEHVQSAVDTWAAEEVDDPFLQLTRLMAKASVEVWTEQLPDALRTIAQAEDLNMGSQFVRLIQARMRYDSGDVRGALATIEKLRPSNQKMLVDRELTVLQLMLQLGDLEQAKKSAQKLFALRLDSDTEFKLSDLMYQLGMKEMGDRMMGRIRRRAGGKQQTLVELMQRYSAAGEFEPAVEIARQIIRRTRPATSSSYRTNDNVQHAQALQILVRAKQIEPLIEQYEKLVERSPRASQLVEQLAAAYEAAGRREEAQKLRLNAAQAAPNDPRSLVAAAGQLAASGANEKAIEMYLQAVRKSPGVLNESYYDMRTAFDKDNSWPRMVDLIVELGMDKFSQNYRIGEIYYQLTRTKQEEAANKLFTAVIKDGDWYTMSNVLQRGSRGEQIEFDENVAEMVADKLCDPSINSANVSYVYSMASGGVATGMPNYLAKIVCSSDKQLARVKQNLSKQLEANDKALFPRVVLCLLHIEQDEIETAEELLAPLLAIKKKDRQTSQALWSIASQLVDKEKSPQLTCKIIEGFESLESTTFGYGNLSFDSSPQSLLITAYENAGNAQAARTQLLRVLKESEVDKSQDQYNPGYGEYQHISSMDGIARKLLELESPAEAFIAYRKAYGDADMLARSERWGGNWSSREKSLNEAIQRKMSTDIVMDLLKAATGTSQNTIASYLVSVEQFGTSMVDTQVALPLEQFVARIDENSELRAAVTDWLAGEPIQEGAELGALVSRLVISRTVDNPKVSGATIEQISSWTTDHSSPAESTEDPGQAPGPGVDGDEARTSALEQELLLAIAASNFPPSKEHHELAVKCIERAISAAAELRKQQLAFGLRCQLASRVASVDKQQSRDLFLQALDELLPNADDEE